MAVDHKSYPDQIIREAIFKRIRHSETHKSQEEKIRIVEEHQQSYVLKVRNSS